VPKKGSVVHVNELRSSYSYLFYQYPWGCRQYPATLPDLKSSPFPSRSSSTSYHFFLQFSLY